MSEKKKDYDAPSSWEYDGGPENFSGEVASPYIKSVLDGISKEAFPDGVEAYQKQRAEEAKNESHS